MLKVWGFYFIEYAGGGFSFEEIPRKNFSFTSEVCLQRRGRME